MLGRKLRGMLDSARRFLAPHLLGSARAMGLWPAGIGRFPPAIPSTGNHSNPNGSNDALQRLNMQAITALNEVDIAQCIGKALQVANAPCADGDIDRLRIKEVACLYAAAALLQGLGQLDEAIFWFRERKRLAATIARQLLAKHGNVRDPNNIFFGNFWTDHVGHIALLGIHVKRNLLEGKPYRGLTLFRLPAEKLANRCLVDHWRQYFTIVENTDDLPFHSESSPYISKNLYLEDRITGPETYFWQAYAEISREWEKAKGGPLLELAQAQIHSGEQALAAMGVPRGAWYVCLHVRSSGFKPVHDQLHDTLNADIATYDRAIDAIVERGGWVIRMGDVSMARLPARTGVVDYAHSPQKSHSMDVFLCGTCRFYVGTSSGLAYVPSLFDVPCVFTNWFPTGTRPLNGTDIFIPKLHWYDEEKDYVPFDESLAPPLGHIHAYPTLEALGISLKDNTPEDLRDVVVEMLNRLEGNVAYAEDDERLQARFDAVAVQSRSFGNARIGRDFVRKYRALLPHAGQLESESATRLNSRIP
jgi:putative glycosyltransferase (TIGR04372 family)